MHVRVVDVLPYKLTFSIFTRTGIGLCWKSSELHWLVQVRVVSSQPRRPLLAEGRILLLCHQPGKGRVLSGCTCSGKRKKQSRERRGVLWRGRGGVGGGWYCDPHSHRMAAYARVLQKS